MDEETRVGAARPKPRTPEEAREAIEETRSRISRDLDAIEHRLVAKKEEFKHRANVARPVQERVRSRPWAAVVAAVGAGVLLGALRARAKEDEDPRSLGREELGELRELRDEVRGYGRDIRDALVQLTRLEERRLSIVEENGREPSRSVVTADGLSALGHQVGGALAGAVVAELKDRIGPMLEGRWNGDRGKNHNLNR